MTQEQLNKLRVGDRVLVTTADQDGLSKIGDVVDIEKQHGDKWYSISFRTQFIMLKASAMLARVEVIV